MHIRRHVELKAHGYTVGCKGCDAARSGQLAVGHSAACRERIGAAMQTDIAGAGQTRITEALLRQSRGPGSGDDPAAKRRTVGEAETGGSSSSADAAPPVIVAPEVAVPAPEVAAPAADVDPIVRRNAKRAAEGMTDEASAKRTLSALASSISALGKIMVSTTSLYDSLSRNAEFDLPPGTVVDVRVG